MKPSSSVATACAAVVLLAACGDGDRRHEITEVRRLDEPRPETKVVADARLRFMPPQPSMTSPTRASSSSVAWDAPAGWTEVAAKPPVTAAFAVAGRDRVEVSITVLPGAAGGVLANMNRWRGQMGLAPLAEADVAALPRVRALGVDAPLVQMDGAFKGAQGFTMAGVVVERAERTVFAKIVGPTDDVRAEMDRFRAFCASLREETSRASSGEPPTQAAGFDPSQLTWTSPEGWTQSPARSMRVVTFAPTGRNDVECYVSAFPGAVGGVEANVNRWRQQLGLPPLSADEVAKLPTLRVLGRTATMVEIDGGASSMFGLVCPLETHVVFVKMTGPTEALKAERARFVAFCTSLEMR